MANFVAIIDADPQRRTRFLADAQGRVAPLKNLVISASTNGSFGAVWATMPDAPVSSICDANHSALVLGDAIEAGSARRVQADELALEWNPDRSDTPEAYDGFYAAVTCHGGTTMTAGTDLLGLFPVYYGAARDVVIVSSSPTLISLHPLFPARLDLEGLVGILLTDALVDNRPLLAGVHRLPPGRALVWRAGQGSREIVQYEMPVSDRSSTLSFTEQTEQLHHLLQSAVERHSSARAQNGLLLSGGRDSRMLAGYLERLARKPRALTMGRPGDYEVSCASRVARELGLDHLIDTTPAAEFPQTALLHAEWDQLSSGFSTVHLWGMISPLRALAPSTTNGYLLDVIVGGAHIKLRTIPGRIPPWEKLFWAVNNHGVEAATLKRMLAVPSATELVDSVVDRIKTSFAESCPLAEERYWRFHLATTTRLRIGSIPWRLSFGSWPVIPILDRRVLAAGATMPVDTLAYRRAQDDILRRCFPELARISVVVSNADLGRPLQASTLQQAIHWVRGRLQKPAQQAAANGKDRRYNWRMYDFNDTGWQAIRTRAEPNRQRLAALFDPAQLDAYLPGPGTRVATQSFYDTMGKKQLVGLMLWAESNLS
jgi:asparagine synthase (glutamine-hydrolysing)